MDNIENKNGVELNDNELEKVTGGVSTEMFCSACKKGRTWEGNYKDGKYYDCPICGAVGTFYGIALNEVSLEDC